MNTDKQDEKERHAMSYSVNQNERVELLACSSRSINKCDTIQKPTKNSLLSNNSNIITSSVTSQDINSTANMIETRKNNSAPFLYLNKSQVLVDSNIKISNEKLETTDKRIDLEANIIYDNSLTSLKNKSHHSVSDKLKSVGKIISNKLSKRASKNNMNESGCGDNDDDDYYDEDDEDFIETYDENYANSYDKDFKLSIDKTNTDNKISNPILYEENDEVDDDNLNIHSDLEETSYFINQNKKKQPQQTNEINVNNVKLNDELRIPKASPDMPSTTSLFTNASLNNKTDSNNNNNNCEKTDTTKSALLMPVDLNLNSSFNSNVSKINTNINKQNVTFTQNQTSIRNLKKMTQGSKAMRIMGNDNITNSNGPLTLNKMNSSTDANNLKNVANNSNLINANANLNKKLQQKRLFFKNGNINISRSNIDKRRRRYLTDIFTTLIDLKWRYNALVFALGFFISWVFFAILWYLISYIYGDLEIANLESKNYTACVAGISSFSGAILFSIETQQTIGYGVRYTTEKCPLAIFVMMLQSAMGVIIQSFMVGVVFAKLSRPKKRSETLMFSKNAVISLRDGRLCLICRVGDMRKSHIVEAHVRMYLIKKKVTLEGEIMPLHMYDLNVGWDRGLDRLFLVWPLTIEHYIDQNSPFWGLSAEDLKKERFEIAVILEGIVESTGMTTQARSSYLVNEILWGHRFEKLITFQKEDGTYKIDYSRFNMTVPVDTPTCSAKDLAELKEQEQFYSEAANENSNSPSTLNSKEIARPEDIESFNTSPNDLRRRKLENKEEANADTNNTTTMSSHLTNETLNKFSEVTTTCESSDTNQKI